ncbi:MAG TPA: hypothetical protein VFM02_00100 [Candidatus Paceibacterota bacterium]|nr:hypothetical protein [Candidatus Paceibacterota bacterium]
MTAKTIQFQSKGRAYQVSNAADLMVCFLQARREAAEETLAEVREKSERGEIAQWEAYKMEKLAAKLLEFYRTKEKLVSLYAEAKRHHPELAKLLEEENVELASFFRASEEALQKLGSPENLE